MSTLLNKEGAPCADAFTFVEGDAPLPAGDVLVPFARLKAEGEALLAREGKLGVLIAPADQIEAVGALLPRLALVAISFPAFRDGRGYSTARLARERYGFTGELRAVGDVREDQLFYMLRCGFDAFEVQTADAQAALKRAAGTFSRVYQRASDARTPVARLRRPVQEAAE
ncbi:MAG: DUF934 domain-containing protein [Hyphomonadaceae bacterium]